jgi:hypothetical protein
MSKGSFGTSRRKPWAPPEAGEAGRKTQTARANARALTLAPIIAEIRANDITRPHAIAAALTDRGVPTARGYRFWRGKDVRVVLDRLARLGSSSSSAQSPTGPRPEPAAKPLIEISRTIVSNTAGKVITFSRLGRPSTREIVGQILTEMRAEGLALGESHPLLAKMVAARNKCALGDRNWHEITIVKHVSKWLRENPDANDYRVALTLKEAACKSGVKRALLDVAIGRGMLRAHRCSARTLILQSDLQRFVAQFFAFCGDEPGPRDRGPRERREAEARPFRSSEPHRATHLSPPGDHFSGSVVKAPQTNSL